MVPCLFSFAEPTLQGKLLHLLFKRQPAPGPPRACLSRWSRHRARRRPGLCAAVQLRGPAPPTWLHHSNCDETASSSWWRASSTVVGARAHHGRQADGRRQHLGERGAEAELVRGKLRIMEPRNHVLILSFPILPTAAPGRSLRATGPRVASTARPAKEGSATVKV